MELGFPLSPSNRKACVLLMTMVLMESVELGVGVGGHGGTALSPSLA